MALLCTCRNCGAGFGQATDNYETLCDECNDTNQKKRAEEDRWRALLVEQKVEELRQEIAGLRRELSYRDARF